MSAATDAARILTLVPWLLERPGVEVEEAAVTFGVDVATILNDIETIGYCGRPPLGGGDLFDASVVGGRIVVRMADELRQPLRLDRGEALRLLLAAEATAAALGDLVPAVRTARDKLRLAAGVPPGLVVELDDAGRTWLPGLHDAIARGVQVELTYAGRADAAPVARRVEPWSLHLTDGAWYLQAYDHTAKAQRTFRLERVVAADVLDEPRTVPPLPAPDAPTYVPAPDDVTVEVVLPASARWVADAVIADDVKDLRGGRRRVRFRTDAPRWVLRLLVGAGPGVEIVTPDWLRTALREEVEQALARYAENNSA